MGFFSGLTKIVHDVVKAADPVADAIRNKVTPQYKAYNDAVSGKGGTVVNADGSTSAGSSLGYYGNPNDPQWGSFAKPFSVQDFYSNLDPGYQFRLQQGQQALANSAAAGSGAFSGAALKDLMDYNQNAASSEYGNAFNRYQTSQGNIFNRLSALAGLGQASAAGVGAQGTAAAANTSQALQNAGTAQGAGYIGIGNSLSNAANNYGAYKYASQNPNQQVVF